MRTTALSRCRRAAWVVAAPALLAGLLAASVSVLPTWAGEMAASWMPQIALGLFVVAVGLLLAGLRMWPAVLAGTAVLLVLVMAPVIRQSAQVMARDATGPATARIVFANINLANDDLGPLAAWAAAMDADVIVLTEVAPRHGAVVDAAFPGYPERVLEPRRHPFGIMILSRLPVTAQGTATLADVRARGDVISVHGVGAAPVIAWADVQLAGGLLRVVGLHPWPPLWPEMMHTREGQLDAAAGMIAAHEAATVVLGDFNATPWSPALRSFAARVGLTGFNLAPTWPAWLGPAGIAIDHALVGGGLSVLRLQTGPDIGSDHRPIMVELALVAPAQGSPGTP